MTETEVVELEPPKEGNAFEIMEKRDEEQILAELKGELLEDFVYSFEVGGRKVTGLSWAGVKEAARRMGSIKMLSLDIDDLGDSWMARAKVKDLVNDLEMYGVSLQSKTMKSKGREIIDVFALQKCVSKAQRNAIRSILPEKFIAKMIEWTLENKKGGLFGKKGN